MTFDPGWPICAVCERPVERVEHDEDALRAKLVITVYCHGDVETAEILERELVRGAECIKFGRAFTRSPKALP